MIVIGIAEEPQNTVCIITEIGTDGIQFRMQGLYKLIQTLHLTTPPLTQIYLLDSGHNIRRDTNGARATYRELTAVQNEIGRASCRERV